MFDELQKIIGDNADKRSFYRVLKQYPDVLNWVLQQHPDVIDPNEKIYLILNDKPACQYNNTRKFLDYQRGYGYCDRAEKCTCLQQKCATTSAWLKDENKKVIASQKRKNTYLEKYGVDNISKNSETKVKKQNTLLKTHGVTNPMFSELIKEKLKNTNTEKYGVDNPAKLPITIEKQKAKKFQKYGTWNTASHLSVDVLEKLNDIDWLCEQNLQYSPLEISKNLGVSSSLIYKIFYKNSITYTHHYNNSQWQREVSDFIQELGVKNIKSNDRTVLSGKELDIVLPDYNIAIECNGVLWHSEIHGKKDKNYHLGKTLLANASGYRLIHITDYDWYNNTEIVKSMLSSFLGKNIKIHARKCNIQIVSKQDEKSFFFNNHLQGPVPSKTCVGLYYGDELIAAMSFGENRFSKNKIELLRFANKLNTTVVGGASKLFKFYISSNNVETIISYSDKSWSMGNMYKSLGFEYSHSSLPSYKYTKNYQILENRMKYQKHKIKKHLINFDKSLTEWENMKNNGYDRIWDCGNDVWVFLKKR